MNIPLREFWQSRPPRQRTALLLLAVILSVALFLWLALSANHARKQLKAAIPVLKAQAVRLDQQAAAYGQLRKTPATAVSKSDLRTLIQAQATAAGLAQALTRMDSPDANQVQAVFDNVPFAKWLAWVGSLQAQHIRLDVCRIEASMQPGMVKVTATLVRSLSP